MKATLRGFRFGHVPRRGVISGVTQNGLLRVADACNIPRLTPPHR